MAFVKISSPMFPLLTGLSSVAWLASSAFSTLSISAWLFGESAGIIGENTGSG